MECFVHLRYPDYTLVVTYRAAQDVLVPGTLKTLEHLPEKAPSASSYNSFMLHIPYIHTQTHTKKEKNRKETAALSKNFTNLEERQVNTYMVLGVSVLNHVHATLSCPSQ